MKKINVGRKVTALIILLYIVAIVLIALSFSKTNSIFGIKLGGNKALTNEGATMSILSQSGSAVAVTVESNVGVKKIECPNGLIVTSPGKTKIVMDYTVEANKTYTFNITDVEDITYQKSFTTPKTHIELTRKGFNIDLAVVKTDLIQKLNQNLIATNFMNISSGTQNTVNSDDPSTNEIFTSPSWTKFGDGDWSYTGGMIKNSVNSSYFTGYYYSAEKYDDIDLSFEAKTDDGDDDAIGAMVKFNKNSNTSYSTYMFLLDRHDNNPPNTGISNGAYNGLNKTLNTNLPASGAGILTKLSVNPSLQWKRSTWQKYRIVSNGTTLEAYIDGTKVASCTDTSISRGTYGFFCYSQANTYFRNIKVSTNIILELAELISNMNWSTTDINIVVNFNNAVESSLTSSSCINSFNNKTIHYLAIGSTTNKSSSETFISNIGNRGKWISSSDYNTYMNSITQYLVTALSL